MKNRMKRLSVYLSILSASIIAFTGFQHYVPSPLKWIDKYTFFDIAAVNYKISEAIGAFMTPSMDDIVTEINKAGVMMSSGSTGANLNFSYFGRMERAVPLPYDDITCDDNGDKQTGHANGIIAAHDNDPDCTGPGCVYIWSCIEKAKVLHFDVLINPQAFPIEAGAEKSSFDLKTLVAHLFGHAIGLTHCTAGDTDASCSCLLNDFMSVPEEDSVMYSMIMPGQAKTINDDDKKGIVALYGEISESNKKLQGKRLEYLTKVEEGCPCLMPENETDPRYVVSSTEASLLDRYLAVLESKKINTPEFYRKQALTYQDIYMKAYSMGGTTAEMSMLNALEKMNEKNSKIPTETLEFMRKTLVANIHEINSIITNCRLDVDPAFYEFCKAELKSLIQIRKSVINELMAR